MASELDAKVEEWLKTGEQERALRDMLGDALYEDLRATARQAPPTVEARESHGRPIFILPGIMGSTLSLPRPILDDLVWIDIDDLILGGIRKLAWKPSQNEVFGSGVILTSYLRMKLRLRRSGLSSEFFPYDWRASVPDTGQAMLESLKARGVKGAVLVCHSMGGLIARRMAELDPAREVVARVITVGTPNYGSYSPVTVFRMAHEYLQYLARIDIFHSPEDLVKDYIRHFPGLLEMMPDPQKRPGEDYFDIGGWPSRGLRPLKDALDKALAAKTGLASVDDRFVQIVGYGQPTIQRASIDNGDFVFEHGRDGDGTVPRDLAEMGNVPRYYVAGEHGGLCNLSIVIDSVRDIIKTGVTKALPSELPMAAQESRRAVAPVVVREGEMRRAAEMRANAAPNRPKADDLLRSFASSSFDPDPAILIAGDVAEPLEGRRLSSLRPHQASAATYSEEMVRRAVTNWHDNADEIATKRELVKRGDTFAAEDEARIVRYANRIARQVEALAPDNTNMPTQVRALLSEARMKPWALAAEARHDMRRLERVIGIAEEFLSVIFVKRAAVAIRSVGRIIDRRTRFGFGTGFMIAPGVMMTNWHVLENAIQAREAAIQFEYELDLRWQELPGQIFHLEPERLFYSDETLDFAVVAVAPQSTGGVSVAGFGHLPLIGETGKIRIGQAVNIVQHPAGERKQVVFRESQLSNLPKTPDTVAQYTGDTKLGSSGGPVVNDRWEVIALHHSGVPDMDASGNWLTVDGSVWNRTADPDMLTVKWVANEGIRISRIVAHLRSIAEADMATGSERAGLLASILDVGAKAAEDGPFLTNAPGLVDPTVKTPASGPEGNTATGSGIAQTLQRRSDMDYGRPLVSAMSGGARASIQEFTDRMQLTVPLTISLSLGGLAGSDIGFSTDIASERRRPADYADRKGFDRNFLCQPVDMPAPQNTIAGDLATATGSSETELRYDNFSVLMSKSRRLAYVAAGNYDRDAPFHAPRSDPWGFDPRLPENSQAGNALYADNDLDRGHLFRRADGGWGMSEEAAKRASADTFHWTNIAPQHFVFNQGNRDALRSLWGQLETHLSDAVNAADGRMSVMNGPIFQSGDPEHRGLAVPQAYFKIAVVCGTDRRLRAYAFVVGQESLLVNLPREAIDVGRFAVFQVKLRDLEGRTGLDFGNLRAADVLERRGVEERFERAGAVIAIRTLSDIAGLG